MPRIVKPCHPFWNVGFVEGKWGKFVCERKVLVPLLGIAVFCPAGWTPLPALTGFTINYSHTVKFGGCSPPRMCEIVTQDNVEHCICRREQRWKSGSGHHLSLDSATGAPYMRSDG